QGRRRHAHHQLRLRRGAGRALPAPRRRRRLVTGSRVSGGHAVVRIPWHYPPTPDTRHRGGNAPMIVVVAEYHVAEGNEDAVTELLKIWAPMAREEEGC